MPKNTFPIFSGDEFHRAKRCILWTWARLRKTDLSPAQIERESYLQSAVELVNARGVFYMNPCMPQTMVCLQALKSNGFKPTLVLDVVKINEQVIPHFAIEARINGRWHHIEFKTFGTNFGPGKFLKSWMENGVSLSQYRFSGSRISPHAKMTESFGQSIMRILEKHGYTLTGHRTKLAGDATPKRYRAFMKVFNAKSTQGLIHPQSTARRSPRARK